MKKKFRFLNILTLLIIFTSSLCFATNTNSTMQISESSLKEQSKKENINSDLYILDKEYEINNIIEGNVFASVDTLNIVPKDNGGIIGGNLFIIANTVNIKSEIIYFENEKDNLGNPVISVDKKSEIYGNVYVMANKFVLEPGSEIGGDLYVCANEVHLEQNAKIHGNVFVTSNKLNLNCQIDENLYANTKIFDMKFYGFIRRDLYLNASNSNINGYIYKNSFISSKNITLDNKFINEKNFTIENANTINICGEIKGDANINSKKINFDTNKNTCIIKGNLNYCSKKELKLENGIVLKEVNYTKYKKDILPSVSNYLLKFTALVMCSYVLYFLVNKYTKTYLDKFKNLSAISLLKYFGIGIGILLIIPILSILLFVSRIGTIVGLVLLTSYVLLLLLTEPIFIISISTFIKGKYLNKINIYLCLLITVFILSLISIIPYLGFILLTLIKIIGLGMTVKSLVPNKKA